jgi:hypothetical protein
LLSQGYGKKIGLRVVNKNPACTSHTSRACGVDVRRCELPRNVDYKMPADFSHAYPVKDQVRLRRMAAKAYAD